MTNEKKRRLFEICERSSEQDSETGYYYYGARYYNPRVSLWLNVDPLADYNPFYNSEHYIDEQNNGGVYNSGNLNPYIYCYQSPVIYVDPNGKQNYFYSKVDNNGKRYLEFISQGADTKYGSVISVFDKNNKYVTDSFIGADAPGKLEAKYGKHYLKRKRSYFWLGSYKNCCKNWLGK